MVATIITYSIVGKCEAYDEYIKFKSKQYESRHWLSKLVANEAKTPGEFLYYNLDYIIKIDKVESNSVLSWFEDKLFTITLTNILNNIVSGIDTDKLYGIITYNRMEINKLKEKDVERNEAITKLQKSFYIQNMEINQLYDEIYYRNQITNLKQSQRYPSSKLRLASGYSQKHTSMVTAIKESKTFIYAKSFFS